METDQEYRSRLAVHPDFPKDEPFTLGMLMIVEGENLDVVGRQLTPPCLRASEEPAQGRGAYLNYNLGQAAEDIEAGQAVALGADGKVRVARPGTMPAPGGAT